MRARLFAIALCALAALGAMPLAAEDDLGTLFFSREERASLDRLRRGEPDAPVARLARHSVTGFVRRSDGRNTVWIDGAPVPINGNAPEALVRPDAKRGAAPANGGVHIERKAPR